MDSIKVFLFGSPRIERDGREVTVNRRKVMALLAYLSVTGQPHSRETLITLFWPDHEPAKARANLRRDLSRLKQTLGEEVLQVERKQVALIPGSFWLDVADFQIKTALGQRHKHPAAELCGDCLAALETAVTSYTADFMAGFTLPDSPEFDEWLFFQREGYRQLMAHVLQQLIGWYQAQDNTKRAIDYGRRWLALDPTHEPAHRTLMKLYAWDNQHLAALRQFEECSRLLAEELNISPDEETISLYEAIKARRFPGEKQPAAAQFLYTPPPEERYEQGELLAEGGHGVVFHGRDRLTGEPVVIKRLKSELGKISPDVVTRFVHEGELLRQLNHPNIVHMLASLEQDGQHLLVMEYVPGGTLRDLLNAERPLLIERVLTIALELADALARAHHLNIVHRDLKPGNVLLAADGTPRLTDFGVALLQTQDARLTRPGSFMGSPAYMSPEMLQNKQPDSRSDIWAFGILLYEMLTGHNPFQADRVTAVLVNILNEPVPSIKEARPDVPDDLADLLGRMLVKDRDGRVASMRQVAAELEAIRAGRPVEKTPVYPFTPSPIQPISTREPEISTATTPPPHNIPSDPTPFLGREDELRQIEEQLKDDECRLLTIVAMGGMGKTRLAVSIARLFQDSPTNPFQDGIVFVSFVGIDDPEAIPATLVKALDLRLAGQDDPVSMVCNYLRDRQMLLVLDNCEQLMEGVVLFNDLLQASPGTKLLVTSREPLNLEAEWRFDLEGLGYPASSEQVEAQSEIDYASGQLFLQTARQVQPGFALTPETIRQINKLCKLVAGMPLAIKLAATWLRVMPPERIVAEVSRNMDILTSRMRDLPPRQRSMRAVFEQTWDLLPSKEQDIFQSLSVFRGSFSVEAAESVIGRSHLLLVGLVDRGLVQQLEDGCYQIHELTRQFAAAKLAESGRETAVIQSHGEYYLRYVANQQRGLHSQMPNLVTADMRLAFENIRAAWNWGVSEQKLELLEAAIEPLTTFIELAGLLPDGEQMFGSAAEHLEKTLSPEEGRALRCRLLIRKALLQGHRGYLTDILDLLNKAAELANIVEDELLTAELYFVSGHVKQLSGDQEAALQELRQAVKLFEECVKETHWIMASLNFLGDALARQQKADEALACHQRALLIAAEVGDAREEALALSFIGHANYFKEAYQESLTYFEQANKLFEQVDDRLALARTTSNIGHVHGRLGNYEQSYAYARQAIPLFEKSGADILTTSDILGDAAMAFGDYALAQQYYEMGWQNALNSGQSVTEAFNLFSLGKLETAMGHYDEAEKHFQNAIAIVEEHHLNRYIAIFKGYQGVLYRQMQHYDESLILLDEALGLLQEMENIYYTGGFLIEKGELKYRQGNYVSALALGAAGLKLVQSVGRKPAIFEGRLLLAKTHFSLGEQDQAIAEFEQLLSNTETLPEVGAIYYELWRLRGDTKDAERAFMIYQDLSTKTPNISYVNRLIALKTAVPAKHKKPATKTK